MHVLKCAHKTLGLYTSARGETNLNFCVDVNLYFVFLSQRENLTFESVLNQWHTATKLETYRMLKNLLSKCFQNILNKPLLWHYYNFFLANTKQLWHTVKTREHAQQSRSVFFISLNRFVWVNQKPTAPKNSFVT